MRRHAGSPRVGMLEISSLLDADSAEVWRHVTSLSGINDELMPLMRMTAPVDWDVLAPERIRLGERLFRSWLLAFGVLPVDYDDLTIVELEPGRRFVERSSMFSASVWEHERRIDPTEDGGSQVTDRLRYTPRWAALGVVLSRVVPVLFGHRHRRLRRRFSGPGTMHS